MFQQETEPHTLKIETAKNCLMHFSAKRANFGFKRFTIIASNIGVINLKTA